MRKFRVWMLLVLVVWSVVMLVLSPLGETFDKLKESAAYIGVALLVSEVLFLAGLAVIAISIGTKVGNPLTLRKRFKSLLMSTATSRLFWAGFIINLIGAVSTAIVGVVGVVFVLPNASWPIAVVFLLDLWATLELRRLVILSLRTHTKDGSRQCG